LLWLCRSTKGFVDATTLCQLLVQQQPGQVLRLLASLLDFLKMPKIAADWLPPLNKVGLLHAGIERLHYYPMAKAAADRILRYRPFSVSIMSMLRSATSSPNMKAFRISVHGTGYIGCSCASAASGEFLAVDALRGEKPEPRIDPYGNIIQGVFWLGNSQPAYTRLLPKPTQLGAPHCLGQEVGADCALGRCIADEIVAARQEVHGEAGWFKVRCRRCEYGNTARSHYGHAPVHSTSLWMVYSKLVIGLAC
jgi:hypothetical protein